jgi:hypothetical protein
VPIVEIGSRIIKTPINFTFGGGFAVDADFGDGFSGSIEGPKIMKNTQKSINFHFSPGGGVGAQAQCFLWGLFFDKSVYTPKSIKRSKMGVEKSRTVGFFQSPKVSKIDQILPPKTIL